MWTLQLKKGENILAEINNIPDNVSEETIFDLYGNLNDQLESFFVFNILWLRRKSFE